MSPTIVTEISQLIEQVRSYCPEADEAIIRRAYEFSAKAHEGQTRRSGEPYLQHPLAVAGILTFLKLDETAIVAALLHDTLEDTVATQEELQAQFGNEVSHLVEGVTKIGQIPLQTYEEKQAENFRKMLLSMADDIRVVFIKLADRLHNMRTLEHMSESKQKQIAQETFEIYAPLANRLGMSWMKQELEDLCFQYSKPEAYSLLKLRVAKRGEEREEYIQSIIQATREALAETGLAGEVDGRPKHLYSIHQKMERQGITFEEVYDLAAIRVITDTRMNCYAVLGLIHSLWPPVHGRFKDYIATPRTNLYQSVHTTVLGPQGEHIEFQIRTEYMHRLAEYGVASHWRYKEQTRVEDRDEKVFSWLRQLVEWHRDLSDNRQFMDSVKLDLFHLDVFHDVLFAFTPKGEVKELPLGATPLDFAYAIHSDVGSRCVGAKINGRIVPLSTKLNNGDQVEIVTSKAQTPNPTWERFVVTGKARARIRRFIRQQQEDQYKDLGKAILQKAFRQEGYDYSDKALEGVLKIFKQPSVDALLTLVGAGHHTGREVVHAVFPGTKDKETARIPIVKSGNMSLGVNLLTQQAGDFAFQSGARLAQPSFQGLIEG